MHLFDLHAHFPMHTPFPPMPSEDPHIEFKKRLLAVANKAMNYEDGVPRMAPHHVAAGTFGGFASVLYDPEDEFLVGRKAPRPHAIDRIEAQARNVECEAQALGLVVARNASTVDECLRSGKRFLVHCVEGGFACGGTEENVPRLAKAGVAYLILGHLTFRNIVTCPNSIPYMPDAVFNMLNPQKPWEGLTDLGRRIANSAIEHRIILDVTHSTDRAQDELFAIARRHCVPVIASHTGLRRHADYQVNLRDEAVKTIADLGGVVGVIAYPYWLKPQGAPGDGLDLVGQTIDAIAELTGGYDHVAIGTDLDGFIVPVAECSNYSQVGGIEDFIRRRYSDDAAEKILWRNALRVLKEGWRR